MFKNESSLLNKVFVFIEWWWFSNNYPLSFRRICIFPRWIDIIQLRCRSNLPAIQQMTWCFRINYSKLIFLFPYCLSLTTCLLIIPIKISHTATSINRNLRSTMFLIKRWRRWNITLRLESTHSHLILLPNDILNHFLFLN